MKLFILEMRQRVQRYKDDREGATAVEFAMVAIPFFTLIFGILELAIIFFVNSALAHSVGEAGRSIATGNFQNCGGQAKFKDLVCQGMDGLGNCQNSVQIDVLEGATFGGIAIPDPCPPPDPTAVPPVPVCTGAWSDTVAGSPVVIRATLNYRLGLPTALTQLDIPKGSGHRQLVAVTAFRNEPFPAGTGTCPTID